MGSSCGNGFNGIRAVVVGQAPNADDEKEECREYNRALAADEIGSVMDGELLVSVSPRGMLTTKWAALRR